VSPSTRQGDSLNKDNGSHNAIIDNPAAYPAMPRFCHWGKFITGYAFDIFLSQETRFRPMRPKARHIELCGSFSWRQIWTWPSLTVPARCEPWTPRFHDLTFMEAPAILA
jgi:hypothetical protein